MTGYHESIHIHLLAKLCPRIWVISQYLSFLYWIFQCRQLIKRIKPDIVDSQYITIYGFLAACSGFHHLVITAMGSDILIDSKRNILSRLLAKYALKKADKVICDSDTVKKGLLDLKTDPEKIRIIFNGIDTQQFRPQMKDRDLKDWLGAAPLIISTRNLRRVYNVEMLIKVIPLVLGEFPEAVFIIGGDGEQKSYLENLARSLGISNSVKFVGWISHDELPKYLASSDIYVSTSLSDSTSLSLQEAMACELAPVVTDLPANREWIRDGENGFIVPINDIQALANKIVYLLKHDEVARKFGKWGREIVKRRAEYESEMRKMDEIYKKLMKANNL
jgi:glycosyltransferase involved in cell wall biosynthesis